MDRECRYSVQNSLDEVLADHKGTSIIITNRITTIQNADTIAVIKGGKVYELGHHEALMASPTGYYRDLVDQQTQKSTIGDIVGKGDDIKGPGILRNTECILKFIDVEFAYPTRPSKKILNGLNLSILRGETLALIGPGRGGKSTTAAMIERFYDPVSGVVQFQGVDVRELNVSWLRHRIGKFKLTFHLILIARMLRAHFEIFSSQILVWFRLR